MNKAQKKILGVTALSVAIIAVFGTSAWAIIDSSSPKNTKTDSFTKFQNATKYLEWNNGKFEPGKLSIFDWINLNMPKKLLVEEFEQKQIISFYTEPNPDQKIDYNKFNSNGIKEFRDLDQSVNSPLICRFIIEENNENTYSFKIALNEFFIKFQNGSNQNTNTSVENPVIFDSIIKFKGNQVTSIKAVSESELAVNYDLDIKDGVGDLGLFNLRFFDQVSDGNANQKKQTSRVEVKLKDRNDVLIGWERELTLAKEAKDSSDEKFSIKLFNSAQSIETTYNLLNNKQEDQESNSKFYQINYTINSATPTKAVYQSNWKVHGGDRFANFHLENEIGFIGFLNNIKLTKK